MTSVSAFTTGLFALLFILFIGWLLWLGERGQTRKRHTQDTGQYNTVGHGQVGTSHDSGCDSGGGSA